MISLTRQQYPQSETQSQANQTCIFSLDIPTSPKEQSYSYAGSFVDEYFYLDLPVLSLMRGEKARCESWDFKFMDVSYLPQENIH